jgi:hypothetical protein
MTEIIMRREMLFQQGLAIVPPGQLDGYEIWPGRRLIDSTVEERMMTAAAWSAQVQASRLPYMGLA